MATTPTVPSDNVNAAKAMLQEMSPADLQELMKQMQAPSASGQTFTMDQVLAVVKEFASELKKPSLEEQEKQEADRKRRLMIAQERVIIAKEFTEQQERIQSSCPHVKENGRTAIQGQVHSDGMWHGFCFKCGFAAKPIPVPQSSMAGGNNTGTFSF